MAVWQPLPWHMSLWQRFQNMADQDKLSHAIVLTGLAGVGKSSFAHALAQSFYCDSPDDKRIGCGRCASCHQFEAGTVSDFRQLQPEEGAASISVDQVRDCIEFLELSRDRERKKIALVYPAERLTVSAANSLLKTLEEPPGDTLIVLLTSQPERLLMTIRSRCQVFSISPPSHVEGVQWLHSQGFDDSALALDVSGNAPIAAREFCDSALAVSFHALLESLVWNLHQSRTSHEVIAIWHGFEIEVLLIWMSLISEWMIQHLTGSERLQRHSPELAELSGQISLPGQLQRHQRLLELKKQRGVSVNRDLLLDQLQILWSLTDVDGSMTGSRT